MIWAKEETLSRAEIERIQLERLKETVHYIYEKVEPYRRKMDEVGVTPDEIQSLDDLKKLPFTYKADFREHYPMGLFAVDKREMVRFHASSGTTGKPTVVGYTRCATGTHSIGEAFRYIQYGDADIMLAGGTEASVCPIGVGGFSALTALSTQENPLRASIPFDKERSAQLHK